MEETVPGVSLFTLASRLNTGEDLLSWFMVNLLVWNAPRTHPPQGDDRLRRNRRIVCGWLSFLLCLFAFAIARAEPKLNVSFDRDTISVGESAVLSMDFEDCSPSDMPALPTIANIQYSGQSTSQSISLNGGTLTRKTTYSVEVHPTREGTYNFPPIEADAGGVHLKSQPVTLHVVKGNAPPPGQASGTAFVRIVPASTSVYLGQVLPVEIQCFADDSVARGELPSLNSDSFIVSDIRNPGDHASRVRVGNGVYNMFNFRCTATAVKTGKFSLGPATWNVSLIQRNFFFMQTRPATFTSDAPEITVLPIPTAGAPAGFSGAVGNFTLAEYEAAPTSVGVGDPITLKIRIAGRGSFDTVSLPTNNEAAWREFKTYPPTSKFDSSDPMQVQGSKYFEQVLTPLNAEVKEIPAFMFSFFNPESGHFQTISHGPVALTVHATAATPQPTVISTGGPPPEAQEQQGEDIVHIKPMLGTVVTPGPPLIERPGFLALQVLPPLAWVCALVRRKQKERLANNPRLRRQRQVAQLVRAGLDELSRAAAAHDADKFYATVLRLLQEQLGERMDLPAPAIMESALDEVKGLRPESLARLRELFQACNQYRYTPEHTSSEMTALIPKVKAALQDLQAIKPAPDHAKVTQGIAAILILLTAFGLRAASVTDEFTQANRLYEEGKYAPAAAAYEKMAKDGETSPALLFNLGNAWFKAGRLGHAILAYRQAERLAPRDPEIRANLQIARTQAGAANASLPGTRWTRWVGHLTLDEWTVAASAAVALFFIILTVREIWTSLKRSATGLAMLGVICLCLVACVGFAANQSLGEKSAVVIVPEAVVRRGPLPEAQSVFTARDGTELLVLGSDGDWLQVADSGNRIGWLAPNQAALVP